MERADQGEQTNVRLPGDLKQWIKTKAVDNGRSFTSELTMRLVESRRREEAVSTSSSPTHPTKSSQ